MLWNEIATSMKEFLSKGPSAKQCASNMQRMQDKLRKEFDLQSQTGQAPSTWPWFNTFLEMEQGSANLHAPCTFSVGSSTSYTQHGAAAVQNVRTSRARPRNQAKNNTMTEEEEEDVDDPGCQKQTDKKKKPATKKETARQLQLEHLEVKKGLLEESRLSREAADRRTDGRNVHSLRSSKN